MARKTSFEIQVLTDKNWVIAQMATDEAQARKFADNLLQTGNHDAVRVVRDWERADGLHTETVVHEQKASGRKETDLNLSPISEAAPCRDLADFYGPAARQTAGRLCRKYFDEMGVTPTEMLHTYAELKRFGDKDRLLFSAIDRVATLQAAAMGEEAKARREFLSAMWDKLSFRAREAGKLAGPKSAAEVAKARKGDEEETRYLRTALLSARLLETRNLPGKLEVIAEWSAAEGGDTLLPIMDAFVADILLSAQVIQDLLGFQPNLAAALTSLLDLAEGKAAAPKFAPGCFARLNELFAAGRLPEARDTLFARVARELGGGNPLSRNEPSREYEAFSTLLHRIVGHERVVGGPRMAEALLQRSARVHNTAGSVAVAQALECLLSALSDNVHRVQALVALAGSSIGRGLGDRLADELKTRVLGADCIDAWVPVRYSPRDRMAALAGANACLSGSPDLDPDTRATLGGHVDDMLAKYLVDEGVIEKIDKADDPLAMRAIRLVKFCGSGVLIEGKSMKLARQRVIDHLRQPQFEEKFLASVGGDPAKAEKHLREFHKLLVESGFR